MQYDSIPIGGNAMKKLFIIFGAGHDGKILLKLLGKERVAYFCDNSKSLHGKKVSGVSVISYENVKKIYSDYIVVVATRKTKNVLQIASQLYGDGIPFEYIEEIAKACLDKDREEYQLSNQRSSLDYQEESSYLIPYDKYESAGMVSSYFWQDLWAARHIFQAKPLVHYDIGSRIDGFIAHLAAFGQRVRLLDIRPLDVQIPNVDFLQCDATSLDTVEDNSIESLSALCSLEHFGLGRYGDPIDPEACFKCFAAIQRKIAQGGMCYISVPIGKEHLEFNAHRVFYASTIRDYFSQMELVEFSSAYREQFKTDIDLHKYDEWTEWGGDRFGLFRFRKS